MRVHLITSRKTILNNIEILREVIRTVESKGHVFVRDWIEETYTRDDKTRKAADWNQAYKDNLKAVDQCDVLIAEASYEAFAVGFQVAQAMQQKKPILILRRKGSAHCVFATGVEDEWVEQKEYTNNTPLANVINSFLDKNDLQSKDMRFNFFIDRQIYNYLRWAARKTGKTKAEIIRQLIEKEIIKDKL